MDIDEKIKLEEDRHYEKIRELNEILRMYNNSVRENLAYIERNMSQAVNYGIDPDKIVEHEESRQYTNPYAKQIEEIKADIERENELHEKNMAELTKLKQEIEQQRMEDELAREREREQKEIELISLQQEINKMENERLEIEKRLRTISMETLGSYFSKQIAERYPEEYQQFQQSKEQVKNHSSNASQISDLKKRFAKVSEDLKLYQGALPVYESYYHRYQEMIKERQQQRATEREQKDIYNLVHSDENERLKSSRILYTAYDLGNKTIPQEYQGMTYEQVDASIKQKAAEEKARQDAKATRDELIGKAVRKSIGRSEDYHLSQIQIQNLSQQFASYSDDELREFISDVKKQEIKPEVKKETTIPTTSYNEFEKNLVDFIERKNSSLGRVAEVLSVTGYPDSTYEVKFENGSIHQITITQAEKDLIRKQPQIDEPIQTQTTPEVKGDAVAQASNISNEEIQQRDKLICDILGAMLNAGEFHNSGLDISQKMSDVEYAKSKLQTKSLEELEYILSVYTPQQEEVKSTDGMHR